MAAQKRNDKSLPVEDQKQSLELEESKLLNQDLVVSKEKPSVSNSLSDPVVDKTVLGVVTERVQSITTLSTGLIMPNSVLKKIKENKVRGSKFDVSQMVRLEDGPKVLTAALNAELGFTPEKLRKIAENLDPRIVIAVEGEVFFDKKLLAESFEAYLQKQQDNNLLQMSRSSRAALRRNIILRESVTFLERILRNNDSLKEHMTKLINVALGDLYKSMEGDDVLAFLESYRINEEKRRLRAQESELERLAIEQLEQLETTKRL